MSTVIRLGDVAEFVRGITFKPTDVVPADTPGSVPCMRTKNVQKELDLSDVWSVDSGFVRRSEQYLKAGDILVSSANSWNLVGKCCWIPESANGATFGGFIAALRPDPDRIDPRYLYHWFSSPRTQATVRSFGRQTTNISNLDFARCLRMDIPLPGRTGQRHIAGVLDRVNALRVKRREAIGLLDDLSQSIFLDMFGDPARNPKNWPMSKIGNLVESANYGTSEKASSVGDLPVLRMGNITYSGAVDLTDLKFMDRATTDEKYLVRRGDVLFNRTNSAELVGKAAIYRGSDELAFAGYLVRARVNGDNNAEYLAAFLNTRYAKRVLRGMCKSIVGMANINAKELQSISIAEPPRWLQDEFAGRIEALESLRCAHSQHLTELDALFSSLQNRAFRGELSLSAATSAA
ncbi:restriction endonuclease subunit S [Streptomyces sp. NBC_01438]|uniref:restriction endonuclease subunit S n=1 Tax=Streptomyces sp. NBC_01438 TaxID=2903866 RepID=UPI00325689AD